MPRAVRAAIIVAILAALIQGALLPFLLAEQQPMFAPLDLPVDLFAIGAPLFFALLVWRRRREIAWPRMVLIFAILLAAIGIVPLARDAIQRNFTDDPNARKQPSTLPLIVPFAQWVPVLAGWIVLIVRERRAKQAASMPRE